MAEDGRVDAGEGEGDDTGGGGANDANKDDALGVDEGDDAEHDDSAE